MPNANTARLATLRAEIAAIPADKPGRALMVKCIEETIRSVSSAPKKHRHDFRDGDLCSVCDMPRSL